MGMKNKVLLLVIICVSGAIGFYVGNQFTKAKLDNYYLQLHFAGLATELKSQVGILDLLRKNEAGKGAEHLEKFIDVNLASLSLYGNTPAKERNEDIIAAVKLIKDYRKKYPDHKVNPALANSVQRALDLAIER
jgi:hypothetical protein